MNIPTFGEKNVFIAPFSVGSANIPSLFPPNWALRINLSVTFLHFSQVF